jgi:hypothetical protein
MNLDRDKINRICAIGAAITFVVTLGLHFAGIPFYITGHLLLVWLVAMMANNSLNKPKK